MPVSTERVSNFTLPEWPITAVEKADGFVSIAAQAIRQYYHLQFLTLRRIPELVLEVNGRGGWMPENASAYECCALGVHRLFGTWGDHDLFLDLLTGTLLGIEGTHGIRMPIDPRTLSLRSNIKWAEAEDVEVYAKLAHLRPSERFIPEELIKYLEGRLTLPYRDKDKPESAQKIAGKERHKVEIKRMMDAMPVERVVSMLRQRGYRI